MAARRTACNHARAGVCRARRRARASTAACCQSGKMNESICRQGVRKGVAHAPRSDKTHLRPHAGSRLGGGGSPTRPRSGTGVWATVQCHKCAAACRACMRVTGCAQQAHLLSSCDVVPLLVVGNGSQPVWMQKRRQGIHIKSLQSMRWKSGRPTDSLQDVNGVRGWAALTQMQQGSRAVQCR